MRNVSFSSYFLTIFILLAGIGTSIAAPGGGITPYCIQSGEIFFLLGEDHHRKGVLTDFGGALDPNESFQKGAAREGHEETMGVFSGTDDNPLQKVKEGTNFFLKRINPALCVTSTQGHYKSYFVDVTNEVVLMGGLNPVIQKCRNTHARMQQKSGRRWHCYKEKIDYMWLTFDQLMGSSVSTKPLYRFLAQSLAHSNFGIIPSLMSTEFIRNYGVTKKSIPTCLKPKCNKKVFGIFDHCSKACASVQATPRTKQKIQRVAKQLPTKKQKIKKSGGTQQKPCARVGCTKPAYQGNKGCSRNHSIFVDTQKRAEQQTTCWSVGCNKRQNKPHQFCGRTCGRAGSVQCFIQGCSSRAYFDPKTGKYSPFCSACIVCRDTGKKSL